MNTMVNAIHIFLLVLALEWKEFNGQAITVYVLPDSPDKPARRSKIISIFFGVGIAYVAIRMFMSVIF